MEALFKSMFNRNGNLEKELCELDSEQSLSDCKPSLTLKNCQNKCDCCAQFYTTEKSSDLQMIVSSSIRKKDSIIDCIVLYRKHYELDY